MRRVLIPFGIIGIMNGSAEPESRATQAGRRVCRIGSSILLAALTALIPLLAADEAARQEYFENKIRPVLEKQCLFCHIGERPLAGLCLAYRAGWQTGGKSRPSIVPGDPGRSLLIRVLRHEDG